MLKSGVQIVTHKTDSVVQICSLKTEFFINDWCQEAISIERCNLSSIGILIIKIRYHEYIVFMIRRTISHKMIFILKWVCAWYIVHNVHTKICIYVYISIFVGLIFYVVAQRNACNPEKSCHAQWGDWPHDIQIEANSPPASYPACSFHIIETMMTSSNGNIFRVTGPLCGEFTGPGEFPAQRPVTRSFDVFFDLRPNKRLSKQPWGWWFETLSWSLWHHCYGLCQNLNTGSMTLLRWHWTSTTHQKWASVNFNTCVSILNCALALVMYIFVVLMFYALAKGNVYNLQATGLDA